LNTAVLVEILTDTVMLIHLSATTEAAKMAKIESEERYILYSLKKIFTIDGQNLKFYIEARTYLLPPELNVVDCNSGKAVQAIIRARRDDRAQET
jgi:hypothetical protein